MSRTTSVQERAAKKTMIKMGIVLEIVPARQQTPPPNAARMGGARTHGVRYHVTCKRAANGSQAFVFDYWGTLSEAEDHAAPATFAVLRLLVGEQPVEVKDKVDKFFTADERAALSAL